MQQSKLIIVKATTMIGTIRNIIDSIYWLNEHELRSVITWVISAHASDMGLLQLPVGPLPISVSNHFELLQFTNVVRPQIYQTLRTIVIGHHFCVTEFCISETDMYIRW